MTATATAESLQRIAEALQTAQPYIVSFLERNGEKMASLVLDAADRDDAERRIRAQWPRSTFIERNAERLARVGMAAR